MIAGWKLAARMLKLEESPDFMSIVPGNTWGVRAHGKCNRK